MTGDHAYERPPLLNLMRVVSLSPGVVSLRTLTILFAIAELDRRDRRIDEWGRLMMTIETTSKRVEQTEERSYRRVTDRAVRKRQRRSSGIRKLVSAPSLKDPLEESG